MRAKAVVFTKPGKVEFDDVNCPDPGADDVVVRVTHSWISNGTEGSYLRGERIAGDTPRRPTDPEPFPIVPGYQKVGIVEWVGRNVHDVKPGQTVFCTMGKVCGMFAEFGGHVSPSVSPRSQIWKLPPVDLDPIAFSGLVLTQVGYNCGSRPKVCVGVRAVVLGDGLVGQWTAQCLQWRGAHVALIGHHDFRLAKFDASPFSLTINARKVDWLEEIRRRWGRNIDVLVDTVGSIDAVESAIPYLARGGQIVSAGFYGARDRLGLQPLRAPEASIHLVSGWTRERMNATLELVACRVLETIPLITHRFPAERVEDAWRLINEKREEVLGVVLEWS